MEALIFIALIIIIILLFNIKSSQKEIATRTHQSFLSLKKELTEIKNAATQQPAKEKPVSSKDENVVQWRPVIPSEAIKPPIEPFPQQPVEASQKLEVPNDLSKENIPSSEPPIPETITQVAAPAPTIQQESWQEKWLRNNPDLEKFIGENLINKIGITVLVLGIAFFVKYAIDQNWIKEVGRVSIGIGCGMLLIGLGHYLRNSYRSFSSVLAGGGLAVLYFTIAFAFHQYQLFSQTAAFIIMVVITAFAVALSLLYNRQELAIIASIGGFITPFLVSTGEGNYVVLFTYLIILNLGMLALSWFKNWQSIHVISLFFTIIIYGGWLGRSTYTLDEFPFYKNAFLFATIFYGLFLSMNLIHNLRMQRPFKAFDFSLILLINFSYYTAGMINLSYWNNGAYHGLFTICLAAINFLLSGYLYLNKKGDRNLLYLLVGLTVTFVSLFIPVQLNGHSITLSWSAEFVLLYWLHQRSGMKVFKASSFVIMILALISLFIDWGKANFTSHNELIVVYKNLQGFVTNIVAVIAFTLYAILLRKDSAAFTLPALEMM